MVNDNRKGYLPFSPPPIGEEEVKAVAEALGSGWISTGPRTKAFERELAAYLNAPEALALNSCTAAMHTALVAAGVGEGDEVITTPNTFAATVNVIEHVGARPVLVDVEEDTLNIDPVKVAAAVTSRTRAILPVHFAGHPAEMDTLEEISEENDLLLIEDAAHALPASYKGRLIGSGSNPTAFSFYATKNMTTGEGGALLGGSQFIAESRIIALHGMSRDAWNRYGEGESWYYEVIMPGYKYNMTDIQAAIGLEQLKKLREFQRRRRGIVRSYEEAFAGVAALELPVERSYVSHAWHLYTLRLRSEVLTIGRDAFVRELEKRNIGTSVHFIPIHLHPFYAEKYELAPEDLPVAYDNYRRILSLPLHPKLSEEDAARVAEAVLDVVSAFER